MKIAAYILGLVLLDLSTKAILITQDWAWHEGSSLWWSAGVMGYALLTMAVFSAWTGVLLMAGVLGNALSAVIGPVANPFVVEYWHLSFNLADIYIYMGFTLSLALCLHALTGRMVSAYTAG